jgi:hypothetical protein
MIKWALTRNVGVDQINVRIDRYRAAELHHPYIRSAELPGHNKILAFLGGFVIVYLTNDCHFRLSERL